MMRAMPSAISACPPTMPCPNTSTTAINSSRMPMTRCSFAAGSRIAHPAPNQAPRRLPASRLRMTVQCPATSANGTTPARNGSALATTTRLIALFRITASSAGKENNPTRSGRRNSAPPSPIRPPSMPMMPPAPNATPDRRAARTLARDIGEFGDGRRCLAVLGSFRIVPPHQLSGGQLCVSASPEPHQAKSASYIVIPWPSIS